MCEDSVRVRFGVPSPTHLGILALFVCSACHDDVPLRFSSVDFAVEWPARFVEGCAGPGCTLYRHVHGSAAVGDVDGNGTLDVLVPRFGLPPALFINDAGSFEDAADVWGLDRALDASAAAFGDVDGDGDLDVYITTVGTTPPNDRHYFYRNDGGHFTESVVGAELVGDSLRGGMTPTFGDYDRDGDVDLHVTEWRPITSGTQLPAERLFRNDGGRFVDVSEEAGVLPASEECRAGAAPCPVYSFASTFTDIDGDGWLDLAVSADFGTSRLYRNLGDGTFRDITREAGVGSDENGMGSTFGDVDGDGDLDWFVTSVFDPDAPCAMGECYWGHTGNRLYRNDGGTFARVTDEYGVRDSGWGWGTAFFDVDNDGDLDLIATYGYSEQSPLDRSFRGGGIRMWQNDNGAFVEKAEMLGLGEGIEGRGLVVLDAEDDGDLDVLVVGCARGPRLYRNGGNDNSWVRIRLHGARSNTQGLGARLVLRTDRTQVREMGTSTHLFGQSEQVAHFGVGNATHAELTVHWPSGAEQTLELRARRTHDVMEPR